MIPRLFQLFTNILYNMFEVYFAKDDETTSWMPLSKIGVIYKVLGKHCPQFFLQCLHFVNILIVGIWYVWNSQQFSKWREYVWCSLKYFSPKPLHCLSLFALRRNSCCWQFRKCEILNSTFIDPCPRVYRDQSLTEFAS